MYTHKSGSEGQLQHTQQSSSQGSASIQALLHLERNSGTPLYRQISQGMREAILSGALAEGSRLPTERALAQALHVNRTTIMNAYHELSSEGLIEGHVGRGTLVKRSYMGQDEDYVDQEMPSWLFGLAAGEDAVLGEDARLLNEQALTEERAEYGEDGEQRNRTAAGRYTAQRAVISLAQSTPAADLLPVELVRTVVDAGLDRAREEALGFCPVEGAHNLRCTIAARMRQRGVNVDARNILVLSGSTQGLGLIGRFLLTSGDEVVVEVPTYLGAIQTMRALGARVIGIPVDREGMRVDLLESVLARRQPRFIYTLPTFQNPTGVVLSPERRRHLLQLSRRYQVPILEDDPYGELYFTADAPQPLKAQDTHGNVLYLSTYSKLLAPGLRVAWLAAPETVVERLALHKQVFDLNTNALGQWIVNEMLHRDEFELYLRTLRQSYKHKLELMLTAIQNYWPATVSIQPPTGGMHLWCRLPGTMRARALLREAAREQVTFVIGEPFHVDGGGHHYIRLSFAAVSDEEITAGIQRIGIAMQRLFTQQQPDNGQARPSERLPVI